MGKAGIKQAMFRNFNHCRFKTLGHRLFLFKKRNIVMKLERTAMRIHLLSEHVKGTI